MLFATDVALALHLAVNRVVEVLETGRQSAAVSHSEGDSTYEDGAALPTCMLTSVAGQL
jgi:hypothetical protein